MQKRITGRAGHFSPSRTGRRAAGFTLIELLVVIAIISILAAIMLTSFSTARESARQATCTNNLQQIALALRTYLEDNGAYPPATDPWAGWGGIYGLVQNNYLNNLRQLRCPNDNATGDDYNNAMQEIVGQVIPSAPVWDQDFFLHHYSSYYVAIDKTKSPALPALLYNYYGVYTKPDFLRGATIWSYADAGRVYSNLTDDLGRPLWNGYQDPNNPGSPTASFPGLINRNPPDSTIITRCMQHRRNNYDLVITVGGAVRRLPSSYDWTRQP